MYIFFVFWVFFDTGLLAFKNCFVVNILGVKRLWWLLLLPSQFFSTSKLTIWSHCTEPTLGFNFWREILNEKWAMLSSTRPKQNWSKMTEISKWFDQTVVDKYSKNFHVCRVPQRRHRQRRKWRQTTKATMTTKRLISRPPSCRLSVRQSVWAAAITTTTMEMFCQLWQRWMRRVCCSETTTERGYGL